MDIIIAKEKTLRGRIVRAVFRFLVAPLVRLIWVKKITGMENLPAGGPYIIAANHQSYFDFLTLWAVLPVKPHFLAAEKFYRSGFWRPIMEYTGQIRVDRENYSPENRAEVWNKGTGVLKEGGVLGIFPQGTRSRTGEIEKTYVGVAKFALASKAPVVPIGIKGAFEVLPPAGSKLKFKKIIELHFGRPMSFMGEENDYQSCRGITNEIMAEIANLAGKEYKKEE